jgi:hypothetical protein
VALIHFRNNDTYVLYSEKNDVQCFSLPDFVGPLWGIKCTYYLTVFIYKKHILWTHFGENFIDIWGGADFGPSSSQSFVVISFFNIEFDLKPRYKIRLIFSDTAKCWE